MDVDAKPLSLSPAVLPAGYCQDWAFSGEIKSIDNRTSLEAQRPSKSLKMLRFHVRGSGKQRNGYPAYFDFFFFLFFLFSSFFNY